MDDLRGVYAPDSESELADGTPFKIGLAIVIVLALGAVGAYYLGSGLLQKQPARFAMRSEPPAIPLKPVVAPKIATPSPAATIQSSSKPDAATSPGPAAAANTRTHARKPATQQNADLQPVSNPPTDLVAPEPPVSTPTPGQSAPEQTSAPAQPVSQP